MNRDSIPMATRRAYSGEYELEIGKPMGVCIVRGCQRRTSVRPGNTASLCPCHMTRLWRKRNPEAAQYARLKAEARKRKKPFDITRAEWAELCRLTRYHEGTASKVGSVAEGLTIDRIEHHRGYTMDNVRVIVNRLNSQKGAYEMQCRLSSGRHVILRKGAVSVAEELKGVSPETELERLIESL